MKCGTIDIKRIEIITLSGPGKISEKDYLLYIRLRKMPY